MPDNFDTAPATGGKVFASDELPGGVHVPRVKMQFGSDGQAADVSTGSPLPVDGPVFKEIIDQSTPGTIYSCRAALGSLPTEPVWQVSRLVEVDGVTTVMWAGLGRFDQVAAARTTLNYL